MCYNTLWLSLGAGSRKKTPFISSTMKGGEGMNLALSLLKEVLTIVVKIVVTFLAQQIIARIKERTAPGTNRDGSDNMK